jgi:hypothetical protein
VTLKVRHADPSLPVVAGLALASGSRAASTEMSVQPSAPMVAAVWREDAVQAPLYTDGPWVFVGIDWGGSHHQLCVVDAAGTRRRQLRLAHDVAGLAELDRELGGFGARLAVAVERAEGLLVEHLQARGHVVYPVSPRIAARARERYRAAGSKDDIFDAFVLADTPAP